MISPRQLLLQSEGQRRQEVVGHQGEDLRLSAVEVGVSVPVHQGVDLGTHLARLHALLPPLVPV